MRLIKCHINSFGKLQDFDYDFEQGVNSLFEKNGYGKTTFTVFLKAMFYGMPKKGNNKVYTAIRSKFSPWNGGVYGGSLTFEVDDKKYTIIRQFASTPEGDTFQLIDESTGLVCNTYSKDIGVELFGVGVETFEITAFLSQEGGLVDLNDEVRATLTGANKFENDLSNCSRAQKSISSAISEEKSNCPKLTQMEEIKRSIKEAENLLNFNKQELNLMKKDLQEIITKHTELLKGQEELKKEFNASMSIKEKCLILENEIKEDRVELENLKTNKLESLKNKENNISQSKGNKFFKIGVVTSAILLILGIGIIISSFFIDFKTVMLTVGIVISVLALILFGIIIIKKVGTSENMKQLEKDNLTLEIKLAELDKKILSFENQILEKEKQYEVLKSQIKDVDYDKSLSSLYQSEKDKSVLLLKIENLEKENSRHEEGLEILKENLNSLIEKRESSLKRLELLEKTKEFLLQAKENVSKRYLQPMQDAFEGIYSLFKTDEKLSLDINLNVNQVTNVGLKEREYLSQGLQDLLSICRRFALLDKVFVKTKPFIVFDDPFVNLDDDKLKVAKELVSKYAEKYQIIYICSHSRCKI